MEIIQPLLFVYAAILLVSSLLAAYLRTTYKEKIYSHLFFLWLSSIVAFVLQGAFQVDPLWMILAFSANSFSVIFLLKILSLSIDRPLPFHAYSAIMALGFIATIVVSFLNVSFQTMALPVVISMAIPLLHGSISSFFHQTEQPSPLTKIYCILIFLNAIHFLDYPFVRPHPELTVAGFSLALLFLFLYAIFLPSFAIKRIADNYSRTLEKEVENRTSKLKAANETLNSINLELDQKNQNLYQLTNENRALVNILCHDLSSPLQILDLSSDMLESKLNDLQGEPVQGDVKRIRDATNRMYEMLQHVRAMHAAKTGKMSVRVEPVSIVESIESLKQQFEHQLESKKLTLTIENKLTYEPLVLAEPVGLKNQILQNLISNAIKFSYEGSEIIISLEEVDNGLRLSVIDQGVGMDEVTLSKIFSLEEATTKPGTSGEGGSGFGLPIVKTFVDLYGASIEVDSKFSSTKNEPSGTVITIVFRVPNMDENLEQNYA